MRVKAILSKRIKLILPVQSQLQKDFRSGAAQITSKDAPSRPGRGAFRDRHRRWARDAMDADAAADEQRVRRTAKSCGPDASTLASSLAVKRETTVTTKPDHRGELEGNRKTIARGMPGVSGVTVVTMLVCFFILHARLRAHRAPGIPCALSGAESSHQTRAHAARTRSRVCNPVPLDREWSEAMDGCASVGSKLDCFAALAMTGPLDREWSAAMDGCGGFEAGLLRCARNDGAPRYQRVGSCAGKVLRPAADERAR